MSRKLRVFESFAGIGSQSLALKRLNIDYEVVGISEIDKSACKAYKLLHGEVLNLGDIRKINVEDVADHDLFTYTFPCQSVSKEGKKEGLKEGSGTESSLLWECKRIIHAKKPKYLFMENVKNLISKAHMSEFNKWLKWLENMNYTNYYTVLNSKSMGIPQNRERVFMVSFLGVHKEFKFPSLNPSMNEIDRYLDDIGMPMFHLLENGGISVCPGVNENLQVIRSGVIKYEDGIVKIRQATKQGYIELKPPGICDLTYPNSKTRRGRVQEDGKVSPTITSTANELYVVSKDLSVRPLSLRERMRLMGLRSNEIDILMNSSISENQLHKVAGNSIVIDVMVKIFECFLGDYVIAKEEAINIS